MSVVLRRNPPKVPSVNSFFFLVLVNSRNKNLSVDIDQNNLERTEMYGPEKVRCLFVKHQRMFFGVYLFSRCRWISVNCLAQTLETGFIDVNKIANRNEQSRREAVQLLFTSDTQSSSHYIIGICAWIHSEARACESRPHLPADDA